MSFSLRAPRGNEQQLLTSNIDPITTHTLEEHHYFITTPGRVNETITIQ